ncbi:NUDIX hydrolase [Candidatus Woesearchaeota archaeon]|nr:NUDIX hydrolase [Candidatus Woesearchaeota archaeon]
MTTDLVVAGFLIHNNKVLLIHHKKLDVWLPCGGHIDKGETPDNALKREFKEELNLDIRILNRNNIPMDGNIIKQLAVPFYVNVHQISKTEDHDHCCLYYLCQPKNPEKIIANKDELKDFAWVSIEELNQDHIPADVRNIAKKAFELFNSLNK